MKHSSDQVVFTSNIDEFLADPIRRLYVLHGLAGTGKMSLLAELTERNSHADFVAPTNKAAVNIAEKVGRPASTIHSLIFTPSPSWTKTASPPGASIGSTTAIKAAWSWWMKPAWWSARWAIISLNGWTR